MNSISNINQINLEYLIKVKLIVKWKEKIKYVEYYVLDRIRYFIIFNMQSRQYINLKIISNA